MDWESLLVQEFKWIAGIFLKKGNLLHPPPPPPTRLTLALEYSHCKPNGYIKMGGYEMNPCNDHTTLHQSLSVWKFYDQANAVGRQPSSRGRDS